MRSRVSSREISREHSRAPSSRLVSTQPARSDIRRNANVPLIRFSGHREALTVYRRDTSPLTRTPRRFDAVVRGRNEDLSLCDSSGSFTFHAPEKERERDRGEEGTLWYLGKYRRSHGTDAAKMAGYVASGVTVKD